MFGHFQGKHMLKFQIVKRQNNFCKCLFQSKTDTETLQSSSIQIISLSFNSSPLELLLEMYMNLNLSYLSVLLHFGINCKTTVFHMFRSCLFNVDNMREISKIQRGRARILMWARSDLPKFFLPSHVLLI